MVLQYWSFVIKHLCRSANRIHDIIPRTPIMFNEQFQTEKIIVDNIIMKLSGLQKQVIHLYRACHRTVKTKPQENRAHWKSYIHTEFSKYKHLPKKQFGAIEHLLRVGDRRLEMYLSPQIKDIH